MANDTETTTPMPAFESEGLLKSREVKTFALTDEEMQRVLEFRRIAEIQREMEGIYLDNIAMSRYSRDPKAIRLFYLDFSKKSMTIREYDQEDYNKYQLAMIEENAAKNEEAAMVELAEEAKE